MRYVSYVIGLMIAAIVTPRYVVVVGEIVWMGVLTLQNWIVYGLAWCSVTLSCFLQSIRYRHLRLDRICHRRDPLLDQISHGRVLSTAAPLGF